MTAWRDGGDYGRLKREIVSEGCSVCHVWTKRYIDGAKNNTETELRPQGEANFRLILNAPKMLGALEEIANMADRLSYIHQAAREDLVRLSNCACAAIAAAKGE